MEAEIKTKHKTLHLTIRATNGATWKTDEFATNDKVGHVARKAVRHFVHAGAMDDGDYALAAIEHGDPRVLDDAETLAGSDVHDDAKLALVTRAPQVDGSCILA